MSPCAFVYGVSVLDLAAFMALQRQACIIFPRQDLKACARMETNRTCKDKHIRKHNLFTFALIRTTFGLFVALLESLLDFIRRHFRSREEFSSAELHLFNRILSAW